MSDLPPEKEPSYNVSKTGQKGGINGEENLHSGTDYQPAEGSRKPLPKWLCIFRINAYGKSKYLFWLGGLPQIIVAIIHLSK
jgi:hypothetical protein